MQQLLRQKPPATHLGIGDEDPTVSYAETVMRNYGALLREPLHVFRLFREETLRDEQREVGVVDASSLDSLTANSTTKREEGRPSVLHIMAEVHAAQQAVLDPHKNVQGESDDNCRPRGSPYHVQGSDWGFPPYPDRP